MEYCLNIKRGELASPVWQLHLAVIVGTSWHGTPRLLISHKSIRLQSQHYLAHHRIAPERKIPTENKIKTDLYLGNIQLSFGEDCKVKSERTANVLAKFLSGKIVCR